MAAAVVASGARSRAQSHAPALFPRDLASFFLKCDLANHCMMYFDGSQRTSIELKKSFHMVGRSFSDSHGFSVYTFSPESLDPCLELDPLTTEYSS